MHDGVNTDRRGRAGIDAFGPMVPIRIAERRIILQRTIGPFRTGGAEEMGEMAFCIRVVEPLSRTAGYPNICSQSVLILRKEGVCVICLGEADRWAVPNRRRMGRDRQQQDNRAADRTYRMRSAVHKEHF